MNQSTGYLHKIMTSNHLKRISEPVSNRFVLCITVGLNPRGRGTVTLFYKLQLVNPLLPRNNFTMPFIFSWIWETCLRADVWWTEALGEDAEVGIVISVADWLEWVGFGSGMSGCSIVVVGVGCAGTQATSQTVIRNMSSFFIHPLFPEIGKSIADE